MNSTFTIARLTFKESSRRWILWVALVLGIAFLIVYAIGFNEIQKDMQRQGASVPLLQFNEIYNFLTMAGLYAVNFLGIMMAVLTSVDTLSGEISSGTVHTLVSKPLGRWEIVLGKWLGFSTMLLLYLSLMAGGVLVLVYLIADYIPPNAIQGLVLIIFNAILLLSLSLLGGSVLSTLANGVLVFGLYSIAFIGGWIEQFGTLLHNQTAINIGVISSLILPSEAIWKRAAYEMQSPMVAALGFSPFVSNVVPSLLMMVYAVLFTLAALYLAIRMFSRRDL